MDVSKISMEKIEIAVKDFNQEVYWRIENIKKYGEPFGMFIKIVYDKEINDLYVSFITHELCELYFGKDDRYVDLTENMERKVTVEEITKALTNI